MAILVFATLFPALVRAEPSLPPPHTAAKASLVPLLERLVVQPGATCLDARVLAEHVTTWLGTSKVRSDLRILVQGSATSPSDASFRIDSGDGEVAQRQFVPGPERCEHHHAVVGLAVALAIRASLLGEISGKLPSAEPARVWALAMQLAVARGVVPGWGFGGEVRGEWAASRGFTLRAGILGLYAAEGSFAHVAGSFDVLLLAARIDACGVFALSSWLDGRACAGFAGGGLRARGRDFPSSDSSLVRWFAVANSLDVTARVSNHWAINLGFELLVPLERTTIVLRDTTETIVAGVDLSSAGVLARVGPVYRF